MRQERLKQWTDRYTQGLWSILWLWSTMLALQLVETFVVMWRMDYYDKFALRLSLAGCFLWTTVVWLLIGLIRGRRWRQGVAIGVIVLSVVLYLTEIYLYKAYHTMLTTSILVSMLATNVEETKQFFQTMPPLSHWYKYWLVLIVVLLCGGGVYFLTKKVQIRRTMTLLTPALMLIAYSVGVISLDKDGSRQSIDHFVVYNQVSPWERFILGTTHLIYESRIAGGYVESLRSVPIEVSQDTAKTLPPHDLIVILGESLASRYMHCYGYTLETTPRLDSLVARGDLVLMREAYAPEANTESACKEILTFHLIQDRDAEWYEYPTLMSTLSQAGYYTSWVSMQEKVGLWQQTVAGISQTADTTHFVVERTSDDWWLHGQIFDEQILPHLLDRGIARRHGKSNHFGILHLTGSHPNYGEHCPEEYKRFATTDIPQHGIEDSWYTQMRCDYVNTVYYNDHVVAEILKHYSDKPAIVIYLSDHGQSLYDDPEAPGVMGHSISVYGQDVPLMIYVSPALQQQAPHLLPAIRQGIDRPFVTDALPLSICDLLGIRTQYDDPRYRLFGSDGYDPTIHRLHTTQWEWYAIPPKEELLKRANRTSQ